MIVTTITLSYFPSIFPFMGINPIVYGFIGGLSLFPVVFKFAIGPISDKFPIPFIRGRRKGYIILGAILNIILLPFLSLNPVAFFVLFFTIWFFQTLGVAIMDIMTDALAIDEPALQDTRGRTEASVVMFFGIFTGGYIVSRFVPLLISNLFLTLLIFSLISLIPLILIIFLREKQTEDFQKKLSFREGVNEGLSYPFVKWGLLFAFILNIDGGLLELTLEPYLVGTLGVPIQAIVTDLFYISMIGYAVAFIGYFFIDKIKKTRLLIIIALIYIIPLVLLGYFTFTNTLTYNLFLWLYGVFTLISGLSFVTYIGLFFDLSSPKAAGTMVALFLTLSNAGRLLGIMIGGFFAISTIYFIAIGLTVFRIFPLIKIRMEDVEDTFYQKPPRSFNWKDILISVIPIIFLLITILLRLLSI